MKKTTYLDREGHPFIVEYDDESPCRLCGLPVFEASSSGTDVCPWCDMGICRYDYGHRVDGIKGPKFHYEKFHSIKPNIINRI